jgi:hypothetical protein
MIGPGVNQKSWLNRPPPNQAIEVTQCRAELPCNSVCKSFSRRD